MQENSTNLIEEYFSGYAAAVAQSRALVSVEDGLKPSMRMALYGNYTDKWIFKKKKGKFLKLVGSASRFCWHGDAATYGMLIRAAKPFAMRYPLYGVQGSYGNLVDPNSHSAPRYTEGGISEIGAELFKGIDKNTISEWRDNYDNTEKYPALLPSLGFWNICNGTMGIGTGVASNIPQFNVVEMNEALINMLWDRPYKLPMPDFATGAILLNSSEVEESLRKGTGAACKLRSKISFDEKRKVFVVKEIPYATYTNTICGELEELMEDESSGIESFNDGTGTFVDIEIYLKKDADPASTLNLLYSKTSLQNTFSINLTMLEDGRKPKTYTLPEAMKAHLEHEKTVYKKMYLFDKEICENKIHVLEGYVIACGNIEEVIAIIKASKDKEDAEKRLMNSFSLTKIQADAILKLTLAKITSLEVEKFLAELKELREKLAQINHILTTEEALYAVIEEGLRNVIKLYGDTRRTELLDICSEETKNLYFTADGKVSLTKPKHDTVIATIPRGLPYFCVTKQGMVYRSDEIPKRAKQIFKINEDDEVLNVFVYDEENFLILVDEEKHFRCKEVKTLNKTKTTLSLSGLTFVDCIRERATKANYKELCAH